MYKLNLMTKIYKILRIGCLGIIGLFVISVILAGIFSADTGTNNLTNKGIATKEIDSVQIKQNLKIKDSIAIVKKQKKDKAEKALKSFKKSEDEFKGNTFYRDPRTPFYANRNFIYPYIGQKGDNYWLRLKLQYASDDWLFINRGILLIDGEQYTISGTWERDNNSGIWEWLDMQVGTNERLILDRIANSKSAKVRYEGRQYHNDRTITSKEKSIIKKTLEIYDNLK